MLWVRSGELLFESRRDCFGVFKVDRNCPGEFEKYINHSKNVFHSTVLAGDFLHIGKVNLLLSIDPRYIGEAVC